MRAALLQCYIIPVEFLPARAAKGQMDMKRPRESIRTSLNNAQNNITFKTGESLLQIHVILSLKHLNLNTLEVCSFLWRTAPPGECQYGRPVASKPLNDQCIASSIQGLYTIQYWSKHVFCGWITCPKPVLYGWTTCPKHVSYGWITCRTLSLCVDNMSKHVFYSMGEQHVQSMFSMGEQQCHTEHTFFYEHI